jgi:hypothetical protein
MRNALPPDFAEAAEQAKRGDPSRADMLIDFLEADPFYFRSGYLKGDLVRWLNRTPLSAKQNSRLRAVVLHVVATGWRREFRRYCGLARRLDGQEFRAALERLASSDHEGVRLRARWVLAALDGKPWGMRMSGGA